MDASKAKELLEAKKTQNWQDLAIESLRAMPGGERQGISFAVDPARHKELLAENKESMPEAMRREMYHHELHLQGGLELMAMGEAERRAVLERLLPGTAWAVEPTLRALAQRPLQYYGDPSGPVRAPGNAHELLNARARWLVRCIHRVCPYSMRLPELAGWLSHLDEYEDAIPWLLAGAIDSGEPEGDEVLRALIACVRGEHEIGGIDNAVIRTLMCCGRPEAWEVVEKLLLAAQRQEGLRQHVLEGVSDAHPEAFRRMCRLILEHDLCRFSSVVRAADVWFGLLADSASRGFIENAIATALKYLDAPEQRLHGVENGTPEEAYFALWSAAFEDVDAMIPLAERALGNRNEATRYAGVQTLVRAATRGVMTPMLTAVRDTDVRVAYAALDFLAGATSISEYSSRPALPLPENSIGGIQDAAERVFSSITTKRVTFGAILWPWTKREVELSAIGRVMLLLARRGDLTRVFPHLHRFGASDRETVAAMLGGLDTERDTYGRWSEPVSGKPSQIDARARAVLLNLLGDASPGVVVAACRSLWNRTIEEDERAALKDALGRSSSELRMAVLRRLSQLDDDAFFATARELLDAKGKAQRLAGLEMLRVAVQTKRRAEEAKTIAEAWGASRKAMSKSERGSLEAVGSSTEMPRRDGCFGLIDRANLTQPGPVRVLPLLRMTEAAWEVLASLAEEIVANKDRELPKVKKSYSNEPMFLGGRCFYTAAQPEAEWTIEEDRARCPVRDLVEDWLASRAPAMRDADGLELLRALIAVDRFKRSVPFFDSEIKWPARILSRWRAAGRTCSVVAPEALTFMLNWAMWFDGDRGYAPPLLDAAEGAIALGMFKLPERGYIEKEVPSADAVLCAGMSDWVGALGGLMYRGIVARDPGHSVRLWRLAVSAKPSAVKRWAGMSPEERGGYYRSHASAIAIRCSEAVFTAVSVGQASADDLLDLSTSPYWTDGVGDLSWLTKDEEKAEAVERDDEPSAAEVRRKAADRALMRHPVIEETRHRLMSRMLEVELARGDAPTEASPMITRLHNVGGVAVCMRCLGALGEDSLKRNAGWQDESRQANLTHLVKETFPQAGDTPEGFAVLARQIGLSEEGLIMLGVFAPQWIRHVEHALGWKGFEDGAWWIRAHMKSQDLWYETPQEKRNAASIAERTPLKRDEFKDGAVDIAWFRRVYETLGAKRWARLSDLAKFACSGVGHTRAQLFANAMLNKATEKELTTRVKVKRHVDSIRALGLVPLKAGKAGQAQVLARYKVMQEIRRTSRKHGGSMLQASEKRAVEIGMENLARAAGYPDPLRLQWAMERLEIGDLAKGPVIVKAGEVVVTLRVTDDGTPELSAVKKGKTLASVPPAVKKQAKVAELSQRSADLRRSASRMRMALEQAMCRGDEFAGSELVDLFGHPLLKPMLQRLVFVSEAGGGIGGYPDKGGKVLRDHAGKLHPLKGADVLRLAHPHDLLKRKDWSKWQRECVGVERVQPFKQVFREVYVATAQEAKATESTRYEGHQVNPRQAMSLLGVRGWINRPEEGVQRTFHKERLTAHLEFAESFYTPAEVEGLTLRSVRFFRLGDDDDVELRDVPPRVLSEAMRDLDLVVSVAHRGGVDPEASQSTVEMRAALARETCALLKLSNVTIEGTRASIKGTLAEYTLHLGSANVQVLPGGHVWIVPVHAQHRGRLFLPFADNDPKSAEVLSKILLLARDKEIQDPSILQQIRRFT